MLEHLTYVRDDVRGRVTVTIIGPVRLEDLVAVIERQAAEGAWQHAMLYDERAVTEALSVAAIRALVKLVAQLTRAYGARGPVAIVCRAADQFGMARIYSTLAEHHAGLDSNVFYDLPAAAQWLDERRQSSMSST